MRRIRVLASCLTVALLGLAALAAEDPGQSPAGKGRARTPRERLIPGAQIRVRVAKDYTVEGLARIAPGMTETFGVELVGSDKDAVVLEDPATGVRTSLPQAGTTLVGNLLRMDGTSLYAVLPERQDTVRIPHAAISKLKVRVPERSLLDSNIVMGMLGGALVGAGAVYLAVKDDESKYQGQTPTYTEPSCSILTLFIDCLLLLDKAPPRPANHTPAIVGGAAAGALVSGLIWARFDAGRWQVVAFAPAPQVRSGPSARSGRGPGIAVTLRF